MVRPGATACVMQETPTRTRYVINRFTWELGTMPTQRKSSEISFEETASRFFSPNALAYAVVLIVFSVMLFSGNGVEHRMLEGPAANSYQAMASPLLASTK